MEGAQFEMSLEGWVRFQYTQLNETNSTKGRKQRGVPDKKQYFSLEGISWANRKLRETRIKWRSY